MEALASAQLKIGVDPLGGASVAFWAPIAEMYGLDLEIVNPWVDPTFSFMTVDHDGKIRMDCSSPYAMASLIKLKDKFDIAFGNDPDSDRHGIVTRSAGLMNPNHFLAVAIGYLFQNRPGWRTDAAVGKTIVSSTMIDRVAASLGRKLNEVPVGFKWFVDGLLDGSFGFGGEESAGASFLRKDAPYGRPTKTVSLWIYLQLRSPRQPGVIPASTTWFWKSASAIPTMNEWMHRLLPRKKGAGQPLFRNGRGPRNGRGADPRQADPRPSNNAAIGGLKLLQRTAGLRLDLRHRRHLKILCESFKGRSI